MTLYQTLAAAIRAEDPVALATVVEGPDELVGGNLVADVLLFAVDPRIRTE